MTEPDERSSGTLVVLGLGAVAAVVLCLFLLIRVGPVLAVALIPLDKDVTLELDPGATGVAAIDLPPAAGEVVIRFDEKRVAFPNELPSTRSVVVQEGIVKLSVYSCETGCRVHLNLNDVPKDVDQTIEILYLDEGSEYLDDITIEYIVE